MRVALIVLFSLVTIIFICSITLLSVLSQNTVEQMIMFNDTSFRSLESTVNRWLIDHKNYNIISIDTFGCHNDTYIGAYYFCKITYKCYTWDIKKEKKG